MKLALVGESDAPIATLIKSGALDLSKPGNLIRHIPKRPPMIVAAGGDRVVLDLFKVPNIAKNERVRKLPLSVITPVLGIRAIETDRDHLYVAFRASPAVAFAVAGGDPGGVRGGLGSVAVEAGGRGLW